MSRCSLQYSNVYAGARWLYCQEREEAAEDRPSEHQGSKAARLHLIARNQASERCDLQAVQNQPRDQANAILIYSLKASEPKQTFPPSLTLTHKSHHHGLLLGAQPPILKTKVYAVPTAMFCSTHGSPTLL